jgi:hypothetical protein
MDFLSAPGSHVCPKAGKHSTPRIENERSPRDSYFLAQVRATRQMNMLRHDYLTAPVNLKPETALHALQA